MNRGQVLTCNSMASPCCPASLTIHVTCSDLTPFPPVATRPKEIRARLKALAAKRPDLIAKIITYWVQEEGRKGR